jgi:hypothetical protein
VRYALSLRNGFRIETETFSGLATTRIITPYKNLLELVKTGLNETRIHNRKVERKLTNYGIDLSEENVLHREFRFLPSEIGKEPLETGINMSAEIYLEGFGDYRTLLVAAQRKN